MKKKDLKEKIKTNERTLRDLKRYLNQTDFPQEKEKCQQTIIKLYELQIALRRKVEQDKKERRVKAIGIIVMIIMFTLLIIGLTIGADNEAERLENIRQEHFIEYQETR